MSYDAGYPTPSGQLGDAPHGPASKRYFGLWYEREPYLQRARRQSRLTIPSLFREIGENYTTTETLPWQSNWGQGVNNLASKLVAAMFPANVPWLKQEASDKALRDAQQLPIDQRVAWKQAVDVGLMKENRDFLRCIAEDKDRPKLMDAARRLVVGGNHGLRCRKKDARLESIRLERYITLRDPVGDLIEFLVDTPMSFASMPPEIQRMVRMKGYDRGQQDANAMKSISVYTHGCMKNGAWEMYQECWGEEVQGSNYRVDPDAQEYMFLRMNSLELENYGRSYCEELEADLQTGDGYYQFLTEAGVNIARLIWLVKSGATLNKKQFAEAGNGAVLTGDVEEVHAVLAEKGVDLQFCLNILDRVEKRMQWAFCQTQAATRDAERVTADEIQELVTQLQETLGMVYSNLAADWQDQYGKVKLGMLQRQKRLSALPKGLTKISIRSGEEALGDAQEARDLDEMMETAGQAFGPQVVAQWVDPHEYFLRKSAKKGIDPDGLIRTPQQVQQQAAADQQSALTHNVAPEVVKQAGGMMQQQQQQQQAAQQPQAQPQGQ